MPALPTLTQRIKAYNEKLLPNLVALKFRLLTEDPFRFFRGTSHLFYEDLGRASALPASPAVWLCGDLHLENFGSYNGDNRLVYFVISDFDEGILGPALWEIARMVTSIYVAFDSLGSSKGRAEQHVHTFLQAYSALLAGGKARHIELRTARGIVKDLLEKVSDRNVEKWLKKRVEKDGGTLRFREIDDKQLKITEAGLKAALLDHIARLGSGSDRRLEDFRPLDVCFRVAGTGSLGVRRYLFLMERDDDDQPHWLLDMKQATPSALAPYVSTGQPRWASEADRVVGVEYRMQDVPEALLTTTVFRGEAYKIEEMQPTEDKVEFRQALDDSGSMAYIDDMATLTASAQLRSSGRQGSAIADELIAFGQSATWQQPLLAYCRAYAEQVKRDYRQFLKEHREGGI